MTDCPQSPLIRGRCPGALRPMASGDGLVVRVRLHLGRLAPDAARSIAALSLRHGNGLIDLTGRANLQLRGVRPEAHPALIAGLAALGLIDATPEAEARRNIVLSPFSEGEQDTHAIARDLADLLAREDAPPLPGKFGFAVECGPRPRLADTPADIRIERGLGGGLICRADGLTAGRPVPPETAAQAALDLARWFVAAGGVRNRRGRMSGLLAKGVLPPPVWRSAKAATPLPPPLPGPCAGGCLVALPFGRIEAETLATLAEIGPLRLTPWRMLLIEGAESAPDLPGLICTPEEPLLRVFACPGAPACPQAHAATRGLAAALAPHLPESAVLHVAGCAKGCAHPETAGLTLTATGSDSFDLIRDGRAGDPPRRRNLSAAGLLRLAQEQLSGRSGGASEIQTKAKIQTKEGL